MNLNTALKGIFINSSAFNPVTEQTAREQVLQTILLDGGRLAKLLARYNIGYHGKEMLFLKEVDEDF